MELVIHYDYAVLGGLETVKEKSLLIAARCYELMVQWSGVYMIVMVVIVARWLLHDRCEAILNWSRWSMTTTSELSDAHHLSFEHVVIQLAESSS